MGEISLCYVGSTKYQAGKALRHHVHKESRKQLVCCVSGEGSLLLETRGRQEWHALSSGRFLISDDEMLKAVRADQDWHFYWFDFISSANLYLPEGKVLATPDHLNLDEAVDAILEKFVAEQLWTRRHATALFCSLLTGLIAESEALPREDDPALIIQKVLNHLESHLDQLIPVEDMAELAGMSVSVFRAQFVEVMGALPKTVYDRIRMDAAQNLLGQGISVTETANRLGYKDAFHFSRAFRRVRGASPREIQKRLKSLSE